MDEPTWRCHQNPFIGDLGIQEPVILGEPQILTVNRWLAYYGRFLEKISTMKDSSYGWTVTVKRIPIPGPSYGQPRYYERKKELHGGCHYGPKVAKFLDR